MKAVAKCLVFSGEIINLKSSIFNFEFDLLFHYCLKYFEKYTNFDKMDVKFLLQFICNCWKSQSCNLSIKISSLNLFVNLKNILQKEKSVNQLDVYKTISAHVFHNKFASCLSLKCSLIQAMSLVILLEISQEITYDNRKDYLNFWINEVKNSTFVTSAPEPLRLSGALAIETAARNILGWIKKQNLSEYSKVCLCVNYFRQK